MLFGKVTLSNKTIACLGSGSGKAGEVMYDAMESVGILLAKSGAIVVTGAHGGSGMEAPVKGASGVGGHTIGYTLAGIPANPFCQKVVDCAEASVCPEIQYGVRIGHLLAADAFIIAAGGGPGTLVELMAIINLNAKFWKTKKKFVILRPATLQIAGWDELMIQSLRNWAVLPDSVTVTIVATPEDAVAAVA